MTSTMDDGKQTPVSKIDDEPKIEEEKEESKDVEMKEDEEKENELLRNPS